MENIQVRLAERNELERVNELREMVNELHVNGRPDIFRPGFGENLKNYLYTMYENPDFQIVVALVDDRIAGFAAAETIRKPESPYSLARSYLHIHEFGVDSNYRRRGVATALIHYCTRLAGELGLSRLDLDVWAFNESAIAFYEAAGLHTYRRYMELEVPGPQEGRG